MKEAKKFRHSFLLCTGQCIKILYDIKLVHGLNKIRNHWIRLQTSSLVQAKQVGVEKLILASCEHTWNSREEEVRM